MPTYANSRLTTSNFARQRPRLYLLLFSKDPSKAGKTASLFNWLGHIILDTSRYTIPCTTHTHIDKRIVAKAFSSRTWLVIDHGQATPQTTAIQASGREATYTPQAIRYSKGGYKEGTFNPNQRSAKGEIKEYTNDLDPHGPHETNSSRTTRTHRIPAPLWTCYSLRDGPVLTSTALLRSINDQRSITSMC